MQEDFDIDRLAKYLHLTPAQVARMAERGRLPGRKIAGQWRFSKAEIHHWLEERIGASDEAQLVHVEDVLHGASDSTSSPNLSLSALLPLEAIAVPLAARTRASVISTMAQLAGGTGLLWDPAKMAEAVRAREKLHPTALDNGVALLHPRRPLPAILAEPFLALGKTQQGIPFGGGRGNLTDVFFLICSTDDRGHLQILARISRLISDADALAAIRAATDAQGVKRFIDEREGRHR